jgi:hypothetical protein
LDEKSDHIILRSRIPQRVAGSPVGGVVERLGAPPVTSVNTCALRNQQLGNLWFMRGSSDMQRRVAPADVMANRNCEVPVAFLQRTGREIRRYAQSARYVGTIA